MIDRSDVPRPHRQSEYRLPDGYSSQLPYNLPMTVVLPLQSRKTRRLEARVDDETAELLIEAAKRSGVSLTQFVVDTARERAEKVLAHSDVTRFSPNSSTK